MLHRAEKLKLCEPTTYILWKNESLLHVTLLDKDCKLVAQAEKIALWKAQFDNIHTTEE